MSNHPFSYLPIDLQARLSRILISGGYLDAAQSSMPDGVKEYDRILREYTPEQYVKWCGLAGSFQGTRR